MLVTCSSVGGRKENTLVCIRNLRRLVKNRVREETWTLPVMAQAHDVCACRAMVIASLPFSQDYLPRPFIFYRSTWCPHLIVLTVGFLIRNLHSWLIVRIDQNRGQDPEPNMGGSLSGITGKISSTSPERSPLLCPCRSRSRTCIDHKPGPVYCLCLRSNLLIIRLTAPTLPASLFTMVGQAFFALKHKLFPSFEAKRYHLQFRHAALVLMMLTCASFTLPAYHQTMPFEDSDYFGSPELPVESSYARKRIHRFVGGIFYYNIVVSFWIAFCLCAEGILQRSSPVWYEFAWVGITIVGELVCLGLMASSRPDACDYHFGIDRTLPLNGKFTPQNSITSLCSNWRGMTGLLAAIAALCELHPHHKLYKIEN
ncbi:hypothetical protein AG1IA_09616 [Rhizoctonia solani AG-1 IA]|uniref:Uncharacterized protein n=1 Tax=Thanatephorus cucumeris (strain AG1-IA) TaxID=983506 RepID=L8WJ29_THACA|nr:hypothetical protein AG1IA_09616 [Rhizoctonia solani AG-1 IA]